MLMHAMEVRMDIKVANQAWIAAALLHRSHPERPDFSVYEIRKQAEEEFGPIRPGVYQHIVNHGLAQATPAPARLRLFTETARGRRRLFRPGDKENPGRKGGKTHPDARELPEKYQNLVDWYEKRYLNTAGSGSNPRKGSPAALLRFIGLIPAHDLEIMRKAVEETSERIDEETQ